MNPEHTSSSTAAMIEHGTLMRVHGLGVLLQGDAGSGKSEAALGLIDRGHQLIADDAVACQRHPRGVCASSPPLLAGLLAIRDLGVLDIARIFGAQALAREADIDLIIKVDADPDEAGKLAPRQDTLTLLGYELPRLLIHAEPSRDLALLIDTAARGFRSQSCGTADTLARAQQQLLDQEAV